MFHTDVRQTAAWLLSQYGGSLLGTIVVFCSLPVRLAFVLVPILGLAALAALPFLRMRAIHKWSLAAVVAVAQLLAQVTAIQTLPGRTYYSACDAVELRCASIDELSVGGEQLNIVPLPTPMHEVVYRALVGEQQFREHELVGVQAQQVGAVDIVSPLERALLLWLSDETDTRVGWTTVSLRYPKTTTALAIEVQRSGPRTAELLVNVGATFGNAYLSYPAWLRDGGDGLMFSVRAREVSRTSLRAAALQDILLEKLMEGDMRGALRFLADAKADTRLPSHVTWDWLAVENCGVDLEARGMGAACMVLFENVADVWLRGEVASRLTTAQRQGLAASIGVAASPLLLAEQSGEPPSANSRERLQGREWRTTGLPAYTAVLSERVGALLELVEPHLPESVFVSLRADQLQLREERADQRQQERQRWMEALRSGNRSALAEMTSVVLTNDEHWNVLSELSALRGDELSTAVTTLLAGCESACTELTLAVERELRRDTSDIGERFGNCLMSILALESAAHQGAALSAMAAELRQAVDSDNLERAERTLLADQLWERVAPSTGRVAVASARNRESIGVSLSAMLVEWLELVAGQAADAQTEALLLEAFRQLQAGVGNASETSSASSGISHLATFLLGDTVDALGNVQSFDQILAFFEALSRRWGMDEASIGDRSPISSLAETLENNSGLHGAVPTPDEETSGRLINWIAVVRLRAELLDLATLEQYPQVEELRTMWCGFTPPNAWALALGTTEPSPSETLYLISVSRLLTSCGRTSEPVVRAAEALIGRDLLRVEM